MNQVFYLYKSDKSDRKLVVYNEAGKKVYFGSVGYSDYTLHGDSDRKQRYMDCHQRHEDWTDPSLAGFWSRWITWNKKTIKESIDDTKSRFGIRIFYCN